MIRFFLKTYFFKVLVLLLFYNLSNAQSDFSEGYIINYEGDSVKGFLKVMPDSKSYKNCYMLGENRTEIKYDPNQIKEYGIYNYAQFRVLPGARKQEEFYEVVIEGKISLYQNKNDFYLKKDTLLLDISHDKIELNKGKSEINHSYKYLGIIKIAVSDCGDIVKLVDDKVNNRSSFSEVIKAYNVCSNGTYTSFSENSSEILIEFGPQISFFYSKASVILNDPAWGREGIRQNTDFNPSLLPAIGINMVMFSPKISKTIGLELSPNFSYQAYFVSQTFEDINSSEDINTIVYYNDINLKYYSLNIPIGLHARLPGSLSSIGFNAGLNFNYVFGSSLDILLEEYTPSGVVFTSTFDNIKVGTFQTGFYGGITLNFNKGVLSPFSFDFNWCANSGNLYGKHNAASSTKLKTNNWIFSINYTIHD